MPPAAPRSASARARRTIATLWRSCVRYLPEVPRPRQFERLLGLKDQAQYGFEDVGGQKLAAALRQARALIALAELTLAR